MKTLERSKCAILPLVLKKRWFDMIALGQKKEEYRDVTKYWQTRIHNWHERARMAGMPMVMEFRLGYAARAQRTAFLLAGGFGVRGKFRFPHPDWGEPNEKHFVLPLGERVKLVGDDWFGMDCRWRDRCMETVCRNEKTHPSRVAGMFVEPACHKCEGCGYEPIGPDAPAWDAEWP